MSKIKKTTTFITTEIIAQAIGYMAGLVASMTVSRFFVKRSIANGWGLFSKREAVDKDTFDWLLFIMSYLIGFAAMYFVNRLIKSFFNTENEPK